MINTLIFTATLGVVILKTLDYILILNGISYNYIVIKISNYYLNNWIFVISFIHSFFHYKKFKYCTKKSN